MTTPIEIGARGAYAKAALAFEKPWEGLSEATRAVYMAEIAAALEAIEAAGYAVVPTRSLMVVADPDTLGKTMLVEWRDDAAPPLVKET